MSSSLSRAGAQNASTSFQVILWTKGWQSTKRVFLNRAVCLMRVRRESGTLASADATHRMQERTNRAATLDRIFRDHS